MVNRVNGERSIWTAALSDLVYQQLSAAIAAPRAPAMSRSATSSNLADPRSARRGAGCARPRDRGTSRGTRRGLDHTAADEVRVGVGEVGGDREQPAERHRLLIEELARHLVAVLAVRPDLLRCFERIELGERMIRILRQPERQQVVADAGQARRRSRRPAEPAVADAASAGRRRAAHASGHARGRARRPSRRRP